MGHVRPPEGQTRSDEEAVLIATRDNMLFIRNTSRCVFYMIIQSNFCVGQMVWRHAEAGLFTGRVNGDASVGSG